MTRRARAAGRCSRSPVQQLLVPADPAHSLRMRCRPARMGSDWTRREHRRRLQTLAPRRPNTRPPAPKHSPPGARLSAYKRSGGSLSGVRIGACGEPPRAPVAHASRGRNASRGFPFRPVACRHVAGAASRPVHPSRGLGGTGRRDARPPGVRLSTQTRPDGAGPVVGIGRSRRARIRSAPADPGPRRPALRPNRRPRTRPPSAPRGARHAGSLAPRGSRRRRRRAPRRRGEGGGGAERGGEAVPEPRSPAAPWRRGATTEKGRKAAAAGAAAGARAGRVGQRSGVMLGRRGARGGRCPRSTGGPGRRRRFRGGRCRPGSCPARMRVRRRLHHRGWAARHLLQQHGVSLVLHQRGRPRSCLPSRSQGDELLE